MDAVLDWRGYGNACEAYVRWLGFNVMSGEPWDDSWVRRTWLTADLRLLSRTRRRVQHGQVQQGQEADDQTDDEADDQTEAQNGRRVAQRREFRVGGGQRDTERPEQDVAKIRRVVWQRGLGSIQTRARKGTET